MENSNDFENFNDYTLNVSLYRISDEVKNELVRALNFWNTASGSKNPLLTQLIIKELKSPYTTTNMINGYSTNQASNNVQAENPKLRNGTVAFKQQMSQYLNNSIGKETKDIITNLMSTFKICIEDVL